MAKPEVVQFYQQSMAFQPGSSVTLTSASTSYLVIPSNTGRFQAWITNTHASAVIYLYLSATGAQVGKGIPLQPNAQIQFTTYVGAVSAISSTAGATLAIAEI